MPRSSASPDTEFIPHKTVSFTDIVHPAHDQAVMSSGPRNRAFLHRHRSRSTGSESSDGSEYMSTCSESYGDKWYIIDHRKVTNVTLDFFYTPRTITLLLVVLLGLVLTAFLRSDEGERASNVGAGIYALSFLFLSIGLLVFPNGPFTRPHPAIWRLVFGMSVLYLLLLAFVLFQSYVDVKFMLHWVDPSLNYTETDSNKLYAVDCSFTLENLYSRVDIFVIAHFLGWVFKALLVRHTVLLWSISIMWECTELMFAHVLPNFEECWWDALLFDVLLANGLGIFVGMAICKMMEVRQFHWESIKHIKGTRNMLKRAVLQFTPQEWAQTRWLDPSCTYMRTLAIFFLLLLFQISELNTFLLKHVLFIPTDHYLVSLHIPIIVLPAAPSIRQYYMYVTDKTCNRLGTQCWIFLCITFTELLVAIKFGMRMLPRPALLYIVAWLGLTALLSIVIVLLITRIHSQSGLRAAWEWSTSVINGNGVVNKTIRFKKKRTKKKLHDVVSSD